jgi:hypothetical protein
VGVSPNSIIYLPGGTSGTLQLAIDDLTANFVLQGEIYWDVVGLAYYVAPANAWTNKFGKRFTFDDVVSELLNRPLDDSACWGTHRLISLATVLHVNERSTLLSPVVNERLRAYLKEVCVGLGEIQQPDGSWSGTWYQELKEKSRRARPNGQAIMPSVIATGHHLEWIWLLPPDLRPERACCTRATRWLLAVLSQNSRDHKWVEQWHCPAIHAARSILLFGTRPSQSLGVAQGG